MKDRLLAWIGRALQDKEQMLSKAQSREVKSQGTVTLQLVKPLTYQEGRVLQAQEANPILSWKQVDTEGFNKGMMTLKTEKVFKLFLLMSIFFS